MSPCKVIIERTNQRIQFAWQVLVWLIITHTVWLTGLGIIDHRCKNTTLRYSNISVLCCSWLNFHYSVIIMSAMASQFTGVLIVWSTVCSSKDQRKHQSSTSLAFVREFIGDRWTPRERASNAENVAIWWRHDAELRHITLTTKAGGLQQISRYWFLWLCYCWSYSLTKKPIPTLVGLIFKNEIAAT